MSESAIESLWSHVRQGLHVAAIGVVPFPLAGARGLTVVRASCDSASTRGVLDDASRAVRQILGEEDEGGAAASPAERALGAEASEGAAEGLVALCDRLADAAAGRAALVLDAVDAADDATAAAIGELLVHPALRLPVVLSFRTEPEGKRLALVETVRAAGGERAIAHFARTPAPPFAWRALAPDVLEVLRAAAVVGSRFDAETVGALLEVAPHRVLAAVQRAVDAGAPIRDEETGTFVFPMDAVQALREGMLPSWASYLHAKLAARLAGPARPRGPAAPEPLAPPRAADDGKAAEHFVEAGEAAAAVDRFLAAAEELTQHGDCERAFAQIDKAAALLASVPHTPRSATLGARLHLERARALWAAAGSAPSRTLRDALASAMRADAALPPQAPVDLYADVASVLAAIAYDLGDAALSSQIVARLRQASAALERAGDRLVAARLHGDEAALHLRAGDPERALEALSRARALLGDLGDAADPATIRALADTAHLSARVPLHARAGAPPSPAAIEEAVAHATLAANLYARLGHARSAARATETLGRLLMRAGKLEAAKEKLVEAMRAEDAMRDANGLARTSEALAELLAAVGNLDEAVGLIESSAAINAQRGARAALAYDRQALDRVRAAARAKSAPPDLMARIEHLGEVLAQAGRPSNGAGRAPDAVA